MFYNKYAHKLSWLISSRSDSNDSLSPRDCKERRAEFIRFDATRSFEDGQSMFGEIKMHRRTCDTHKGVGDESILSESERYSEELTKIL